jgi:mono/diheme cytochrome c family protein
VYTLALANADGSDPRPISYHETHEWDPVVTNDGRVLYTRWDYVDRNAVFYQQLWSVRPDGSDVRIFYGNNTYNPVGIWEARAVPGSNRVMATAAAHHAMTAGSIILMDITRGVDGPDPIARLTPDAMFPESEVPVINRHSGSWYAPIGLTKSPELPPEAVRWPGHCYRTPCPLSEKYFFAAYSFDPLIGEPDPNWPAMFGLYLVDCFGNKELIYRDPEISSLWPAPLRPRTKPPALPSLLEPSDRKEGVFLLRDVHLAWPPLPEGSVKRLRIVQVLPKTTWHANNPMVGLASASPGKQVLGTVPVESDGSAYFRAPAGIPLAFQALDEFNQAVQVMRSVTYLQPGESASCVGCHEPRSATPPSARAPAALARGPSAIEPGPDGSNPLSYPLLVQPVLDKHCVSCHNPQKPEGKVILTGEPQGHYTASYNALAPKVSYSAWGGKPGDFRQVNSEPLSQPGFFGSRNDPLLKLLRKGHYDVSLSPTDYDRLATWMDANALFYGTFDPADQARQRRGERIAGPKLE